MRAKGIEEGGTECFRRIFRAGPAVWSGLPEVGAMKPPERYHSNATRLRRRMVYKTPSRMLYDAITDSHVQQ